MPQICIPTPPLDEIQTVDLEISIDGKPQRMQYRIETFEWPAASDDRVAALQAFVTARGSEWLLVQIGPPAQERVPLLFRLRASAVPTAAPAAQP